MSAVEPGQLERLVAELTPLGNVRRGEPLARHTTFGVGGPADLYLKLTSVAGLAAAATAARRNRVPLLVLGSGSNVLVGDDGVRGLVIENDAGAVAEPERLPDGRERIACESGASFAATARRLCRAGYWGLEWAVGIPGTLGGAVVYNAGAYGGCLADVLISIEIVEPGGARRILPAAELGLEYRGSVFTRGLLRDRVILGVEFALRTGDPQHILAHIAQLDEKRRATQPRGRNAGSIFKNPPEHPAWWLIDQVGLRGERIGDAEISAKHANFFSNVGHASAHDVKTLMDRASERVRERFGIELHAEVALVGEGF
jgi:UDP-N-acetylmuramate dehydrogenase